MAEQPCPFCEITQDPSNSRLLTDSEHAFVIADGYPVTDGHTLIIPKRHVAPFNPYQYWQGRNAAALGSIEDIAAQAHWEVRLVESMNIAQILYDRMEDSVELWMSTH